MKQQLLSLIISATDKASNAIGKVVGGLDKMGGAAQQAQQKSDGLSNAVAFGFAKAQLAIELASRSIDFLKNKFQEAASIELENLSTASGLEKMIGSFDEATKFVDRMNASLAKSAATLPGATADYTALARTITDDVAEAFKDTNGQIKDLSGFEKTLKSISTSYAAMGATTGVAVGNTQLFLMKALGGTASMAELMQIDALQKNTQLRVRLQDALQQAGVKELKQLTQEGRIALLEQVGRDVITPEFLKRSQETVEGMTQGFISTLFDPMGGLFGLARDLDDNTEGVQSAYFSLRDLMKAVIGSGGLVETASGLLQDLGLTIDPMKMLKSGVDTLTRWTNGLTQFLQGFRGANVSNFNIANLGQIAMQKFNQFLSNAADFLDNLDLGDTASLGNAVGDFLGKLVNEVIEFWAGVDRGALFSVLSNIAAQLLSFLGGLIQGLAGQLIDKFSQEWQQVIAGVGEAISDFGTKIWDAIKALIQQLTSFVTDKIQQVGQAGTSGVAGIAATNPVAGAILNPIANLFGGGGNWRGYIPNAAGGFLGALVDEVRNMPSGASPIVANTSETILTPRQLRNLVTGAVGMGAGAGGGTFAPQITIQGATNPEETAREVLRYLEIFWSEYQAGALA